MANKPSQDNKKKKQVKTDPLVRNTARMIKGLLLAHAFKVVVREGIELLTRTRERMTLRVDRIDGKPIAAPIVEADLSRINVEVIAGFVKRAWIG